MLKHYKTKDCDEIFRYFMDAFSLSLTKGKGTVEFKNFKKTSILIEDDPNDNVKSFLRKIMQYIDAAQPKVIFEMLIEQDYLFCLRHATDKQMYQISLLQVLATCLAYDDIETFFDTSNMWSNNIVEIGRASCRERV